MQKWSLGSGPYLLRIRLVFGSVFQNAEMKKKLYNYSLNCINIRFVTLF